MGEETPLAADGNPVAAPASEAAGGAISDEVGGEVGGEAGDRAVPAGSTGERAGLAGRGRSGRRRSNADGGAREFKVEIKLTPDEFARVEAEARIRNISRPAVFTRSWNSDGATAAAHYDMLAVDLWSTRKTLARVSDNLNQAVKLEHTRRMEDFDDGAQFHHELAVLTDRIDQVMEDITRIVRESER